MNILGLIKKPFGWIWRALDGLRKVLQLIVLLFVFIVVLASLAPDDPVVPENVALVLAPDGDLVDQLSGDPLDRAIARARGMPIRETLLKDLIDAVRAAADDERIRVLVLRLEGLGGAGLSKLQELADEIVQFKESGKQVIALGDNFTRNQYYLAAHADEIYLHPMGLVFVEGYSRYPMYYREALEKVLVDFHVWAIGEYKSFVEPISRDNMSDEDREAAGEYLAGLWNAYQADVTAARGLAQDALQQYADNAPALLAAAGGDTGRLALDQALVDELLARDQMNARIRAIVEPEDEGDDEEDDDAIEVGYPRIGYGDYLQAVRRDEQRDDDADAVAVLVASGTILDGQQPPGTIGGDSTAALIRDLADNDEVKALVLRVDSGGGSAFASEVIRRELEVFQESGRPLVVSMGSVAASGGYWISMSAEEIWASSSTLTGSIGIGATIPTAPRTLNALGIHVDGVGTTELAGQFNLLRPLGPDVSDMIGQSIEYGYEDFITKVATHRDQSVAAIDTVARGRVWTGERAQEHDLVDRIGDLDDAIASAAELAGLAEDEYEIRYLEDELELAEQIVLEFVRSASPVLSALRLGPEFSPAFLRLLTIAAEPFKWVDALNDPKNLYAYCFCEVR